MEYDVTIDRDKYIGGSDIPIIMGLSTFRTRWQLLLEKAGLEQNPFEGNAYTDYGNILEPKIRNCINAEFEGANFVPYQIIDGDLRANMDGFNGTCVLEIKTTSNVADDVHDYRHYLVQLLFYMSMANVEHGLLAVYERPNDFSTDFERSRLHIYRVSREEYPILIDEIAAEICRFRADLERLKENPLMVEEDFQPNELVQLFNKVLVIEKQLANYKALEQEYKTLKQQLFEAMQTHNVKSWKTINGVTITRVDGTQPTTKTVQEFDLDKFKAEHPDEYATYVKSVEKTTAGRSGYVKITLPKG